MEDPAAALCHSRESKVPFPCTAGTGTTVLICSDPVCCVTQFLWFHHSGCFLLAVPTRASLEH